MVKIGKRQIYVPSYGLLEKEEIDYILEAEQEIEGNRIRTLTENRAFMEELVNAALQAPPGKRAQLIKEMLEHKKREI